MPDTLGLISWAAQWSSATNSPALVEERTLSNPAYQGAAPPHAINVRPGRIKFDATQARMDTEIGYLNMLGPNVYLAYLMYTTGLTDAATSPGMDAALDLYIASTVKGTLKWCMIQQPVNMGAPGDFTSQVNTMADLMIRSDYQRVLTNRPLLYIYAPSAYVGGLWLGNNAAFATMLTALRARVQSLGAGNPYIVMMQTFGGATAETFRAAVGADAVTLYATGVGKRNATPYVDLATYAATFWTDMLAASAQVPLCMAGWDRRAREARPGPWEPQYLPRMGSSGGADRATDAELAAHITSWRGFMDANLTKCPARTGLIYSKDEYSEGGSPIMPTRADIAAGTWPARAAAIAAAIGT